jgi:hypothetical protein
MAFFALCPFGFKFSILMFFYLVDGYIIEANARRYTLLSFQVAFGLGLPTHKAKSTNISTRTARQWRMTGL